VFETFPEKIKIVFKHYPLGNHPLAAKAAFAAQAAHLQGRFWQIHNELFKHNGQLSEAKLQEAVRAPGINAEQLDRDLKNPAVTTHVQADVNEAVRIGVRGVPAVYVNGKRLRDRSQESLAAAVQKELAKHPATNR
jgi:protein-disulfide isomerase